MLDTFFCIPSVTPTSISSNLSIGSSLKKIMSVQFYLIFFACHYLFFPSFSFFRLTRFLTLFLFPSLIALAPVLSEVNPFAVTDNFLDVQELFNLSVPPFSHL